MGLAASSQVEDLLLAVGGVDPAACQRRLAVWCERLRLECSSPFLVGWYNDMRRATADGAQLIDAPETAVAFVLCSVPGYIDVVVEHFARQRPPEGFADFVDSTTNEILDFLRVGLAPADPLVLNTDKGPPYYHVQTMGAVAGLDQHLATSDFDDAAGIAWREKVSDELEDRRDRKMWGTDPETLRKIFSVNMHPVWGGWYAYRALVVLRGARAEGLQQPTRLQFLPTTEAQRVLAEFNLRHEQCLWRDLSAEGHAADRRYRPEEFFFFTETSPAKRRRFLEMHAAHFAAPPPFRGSLA